MRHAQWIILAAATAFLGGPMDAEEVKPLDPEEHLLAALNCGVTDAPAGWRPIAQWTVPGAWPLTTSLRAYHAASFGSGRMNVDYMVCHVGWFDSLDSAHQAYQKGVSLVGTRGDEVRAIGDEARLVLGEGRLEAGGDSPQQNTYQLTFRNGPLMYAVAIVTVQQWSRERLETFGRSLDTRYRAQRPQIEAINTSPRLLKDKLTDQSHAPVCDKTCWVHNEKFTAVLLPTGGGLRMDVRGDEAQQQTRKEYWDAHQRLFPNAAPAFIDVGCIHDPLHEKDWTCSCPSCTAAEEAWRAERKPPMGRRP